MTLDGTASTGDGTLTCAWTFEDASGVDRLGDRRRLQDHQDVPERRHEVRAADGDGRRRRHRRVAQELRGRRRHPRRRRRRRRRRSRRPDADADAAPTPAGLRRRRRPRSRPRRLRAGSAGPAPTPRPGERSRGLLRLRRGVRLDRRTTARASATTAAISGATRVPAGKHGKAMRFDGTNDIVTVADSASLDLTTGMTLEAWVRPTALSTYRPVIVKERGTQQLLLHAVRPRRVRAPGRLGPTGADHTARGTAALPTRAGHTSP